MFDEYARICIFDGSGSGDANWLSDFFSLPKLKEMERQKQQQQH